MTISIGKWRRIQTACTEKKVFCILALDHRGNLRRALSPDDPESVSIQDIITIKHDVSAALAPEASAILLDPETGAVQFMGDFSVPGNTGLILTLDATGYSGDAHNRTSRILDGWSVGQACRMGASGVKLLVYYHPDSPDASNQEKLVSEVSQACTKFDIPFYLEPLTYSIDPNLRKLSSDERRQVITTIAKKFSAFGADILKLEFPVDVSQEKDKEVWRAACQEVSAACGIPWLLLSAGVDFETFLEQAQIACEAGASGVMAGRAIWKEAVGVTGPERRQFLTTTARERMAKLGEVCNRAARPFTDLISPPDYKVEWYPSYEAP
ncbi:MAG: tagatose 1,6-diphosphate aldolase [Anaerolineales bacterium]